MPEHNDDMPIEQFHPGGQPHEVLPHHEELREALQRLSPQQFEELVRSYAPRPKWHPMELLRNFFMRFFHIGFFSRVVLSRDALTDLRNGNRQFSIRNSRRILERINKIKKN